VGGRSLSFISEGKKFVFCAIQDEPMAAFFIFLQGKNDD